MWLENILSTSVLVFVVSLSVCSVAGKGCVNPEPLHKINPNYESSKGNNWFGLYLKKNSYTPGETDDCNVVTFVQDGPGQLIYTYTGFKSDLSSVHVKVERLLFDEQGDNATYIVTASSMPHDISSFRVVGTNDFKDFFIGYSCEDDEEHFYVGTKEPIAPESVKQKVADTLKDIGLSVSDATEIDQSSCYPQYV